MQNNVFALFFTGLDTDGLSSGDTIFVQFAFTGTQRAFIIENFVSYNGLQLGCIIDGKEHVIALGDADNRYDIPVSGGGVHRCILFKRQDSTHSFVVRQILLSDDADLRELPPLLPRNGGKAIAGYRWRRRDATRRHTHDGGGRGN